MGTVSPGPALVAERGRLCGVLDWGDALTLHLAKFRALYTNLVILVYADDIRDECQVAKAKRALALTIA